MLRIRSGCIVVSMGNKWRDGVPVLTVSQDPGEQRWRKAIPRRMIHSFNRGGVPFTDLRWMAEALEDL